MRRETLMCGAREGRMDAERRKRKGMTDMIRKYKHGDR